METVHTETLEHLRIDIIHDQDPFDPRDDDNLGTLALYHRRYTLGDKHAPDMDTVKELIESGDVYYLNVYGYEHSGITINTSGYSCPWDSGQLGVIYVSKEKLKKEQMGDYPEEQVLKYLDNEVKTYDDYLNQNCYGYIITDTKTDEELDSCYGFLGDYQENALAEALSSAKWFLKEAHDKLLTQVCFT